MDTICAADVNKGAATPPQLKTHELAVTPTPNKSVNMGQTRLTAAAAVSHAVTICHTTL